MLHSGQLSHKSQTFEITVYPNFLFIQSNVVAMLLMALPGFLCPLFDNWLLIIANDRSLTLNNKMWTLQISTWFTAMFANFKIHAWIEPRQIHPSLLLTESKRSNMY